MSITVVINDSYAPPTPTAHFVRWKASTDGSHAANWQFSYERFAKHLPAALTAEQQDWLEIFGALYIIDRVSARDPLRWSRDIEAYVPVRDPARWNGAEPRIADVWNRLTGDKLSINFMPNPSPFPAHRPGDPELTGVSGVSLFSGGIDSFTAALVLLDQGERPGTVSHMSSPAVQRPVDALISRLGSLPRPAPLPVLSKNGASSGIRTDESQRARSLLYIAAATLAAHCLGVPNVWVGENGILAVHEPETEARLPSLSTRTAHPQVLSAMERLARQYLDPQIVIRNPLEMMTKAEVVARARDLGHGDLIPLTVSCWQISRGTGHCGYCIPCLHRKVATDKALVPDVSYLRNPWSSPSSTGSSADEEDNLVHLLALASEIVDASLFEIELTRPGLLGVGGGLSDSERIDLHKRWAKEVLEVAGNYPRSSQLI